MSEQPSFAGGDAVSLSEENALLRAALAEAHRRLEALERDAGGEGAAALPDSHRFERELGRAVQQAERHGTPAAVLTIDLAAAGGLSETALVQAANRIGGLIRATDLLARTGGSRLSLLLDHLDQNSAIETADRLARCIRPPERGGTAVGAVIAVTGILPGDTVEEVLERAERNLERLKAGF